MYAESYGVPSTLESAAKWISWAQDQAAANFRKAGDDGERATRYNLTQFWNEKAARWGAASQNDRAGLEKLDSFAHAILSRLEGQLAVLANTDSPERSAHLALAQDYAAKAQAHATAAGSLRMTASSVNLVKDQAALPGWIARNVPDDRYSTAFKDAASGAVGGFLGVPLWAWGLGAAGLLLLLLVD